MHRRLMGVAAGLLALATTALAQDAGGGNGSAAPFRLSSAYLVDGQTVPISMVGSAPRCGGGRNQSPQLSWSGVPAGTKTFALSLFDPDARAGKGFSHWLVYNIPASASGLDAGAGGGALAATPVSGASTVPAASVALPDGAENGANGTGQPGYIGPCPPAGDEPHHYVFTLYALDLERLTLPEGATAADLPAAVEGHILGKATLTGLYGVPGQ